jgi:hypothetical protein
MAKTRSLFLRHFNILCNDSVPSRDTIKLWVYNFRETASAVKKRRPGRPRTVRTPEKVGRLRAAVLQSPRRSARRQSTALQLQNPTARRILRKDLSFHPHNVQLIQELSNRNVEN